MKTLAIFSLLSLLFIFILTFIAIRSGKSTEGSETICDEPCTGCASSLGCQHMHLGKAKDAGYDSKQITYCAACNDYVQRQDHCSSYLPRGCSNGICAYAGNNEGGYCYCQYLGTTVSTTDSCSYYRDFFDTDIGKTLLD